MCPKDQYLFKDDCFSSAPEGTYCQVDKICTECEMECAMTNSQMELTVIQRQKYVVVANPKIYEDQCFSDQPNQTYCDYSSECYKCGNESCARCNSTLEQCTTCQKDYFFYQQNCFSSRPKQTYCDQKINNQSDCEQCKVDDCLYCDINLNDCNQCENSKYLYNKRCLMTRPDNTYCDSNKVCQIKNTFLRENAMMLSLNKLIAAKMIIIVKNALIQIASFVVATKPLAQNVSQINIYLNKIAFRTIQTILFVIKIINVYNVLSRIAKDVSKIQVFVKYVMKNTITLRDLVKKTNQTDHTANKKIKYV
ncbi:transmembrane protein, putative (macronuclear) [Tetrahymena thermophila SB210]|uniref:Transmembrane protein, putative n=1 Tax=Tetrahymena thermophila (strain SB210) TaxID=312017 RepID=W7XHA4_TETTS|nr:transmembrane protein, putative [Tetrahymena thermophila SB210]EWS76578.1 transmembrane protein, putative [Tetrahymena thermophila SB210]|eukprot:XP_012650864.1 transmembrane protein, putative [Tetrahymena thermophila SB210]